MSRKDYVAIAAAFRDSLGIYEGYAEYGVELDGDPQGHVLDALTVAANKIADVLANDNPNFDRERFLKAAFRRV